MDCSKEIQKLHDAIRSGDLETVKNFIASHPDDKIAVNSSTKKSALGVAEEANQIIYEYLRNANFERSRTENYKIKEENKKHFQKPENSHLEFISSKVEFKDEPDVPGKKLIVKEMLENLNKIDKIRPILKAVECSDQLRITFDFNEKTTQRMDPTTGPGTLGNCYYKNGHVYVGALGYEVSKRYQEIMGVFIHELTHHALFLVYDNDCNPYHAGDMEANEKFEKIVETLEENQEKLHPTLRTAFKHPYTEDCYGLELIARATQVLAEYDINSKNMFDRMLSYFRSPKLEIARSNAEELFEFFENVTLMDIRTFDWSKNLIRQINNEKGSLYDRLSSGEIILKVKPEFDDTDDKIKIIGSNAPYLTLVNEFEFFNTRFEGSCKYRVIFLSIDSLLDDSKPSQLFFKLKDALYSESKPVAVVYCNKTAHETVKRIISIVANFGLDERIVLITNTDVAEKLKESHPNSEKIKFSLVTQRWTDLTEESQINMFAREANFQGRSLQLSNIISTTSASTNFLPMQAMVDGSLQISEPFNLSYKGIFMERKLIFKETGREIDEIKNFPGSKILISDPAGTGKSVIMEKIAMDLLDSHNWISFVDLKAYTDTLESVEKSYTSLDFLDFMQKVFKRCNNDFDREILKELYNEGRVTLLLDSFDEISPNYKEIVSSFIGKFNTRNGNQLWVATRPHLEEELQSKFGFTVVALKELTKEDQIKYLVKLWRKSDEETVKKAENLFNQLQRLISSDSGFIGYPLLIKMVAEIYENENLNPGGVMSYYSLYDLFWEKHLENWRNVSRIAQREQIVREMDPDAQNPTKIHQNIALQALFGFDVEIDETWTDEMIVRLRIIVKIENSFEFVHKTFAEYFVASYILKNMSKKKIQSNEIQTTVGLLKKILLFENSYWSPFEVIRWFLNEGLAKIEVNQLFRSELRSLIQETINCRSRHFFSVVLQERLDAVFDLYQFHNFDPDIIENLLETYMLCLNPTFRDMKVPFYIFAHVRENFQTFFIKVLKSLSIERQKNVLMNHEGILDAFDRPNILYCLMENPHGHYLKAFEYLTEIFGYEEMRKMFLRKPRYENILEGSIANGSLNSTSSVLVRVAFEFLKQHLNSKELKYLIFESEPDGRNCFYSAARYGDKHAINEVFKIATELFENQQELAEILRSQINSGETLLRSNLQNNKNHYSLETLCSNLSQFFSIEEILNMLFTERRLSGVFDFNRGRKRFEEIFFSITKLLSIYDFKKLTVKCLFEGECFDVEFRFDQPFKLFEDEDLRENGRFRFNLAAIHCFGQFLSGRTSMGISDEEFDQMPEETNGDDEVITIYLIVRGCRDKIFTYRRELRDLELEQILMKHFNDGDDETTQSLQDYLSEGVRLILKIKKTKCESDKCKFHSLMYNDKKNTIVHSIASNRRLGVLSIVLRVLYEIFKI